FETKVLRIAEHMLRNAIHDGAHLHFHTGCRNLGLENRRAIWCSENGLGDIFAHLPSINIKGRYDPNVLRADATDFPVHQATDIGGRAIPIIVQALYKGTCTIAETDDGDFDHVFSPFIPSTEPNGSEKPNEPRPELIQTPGSGRGL